VAGVDLLLARTGYTGELGYELYIKGEGAEKVWDVLWSAGQEYDIAAVGLGARDTLRLEMKYCLFGNDIDETTNTIESGLAWITKLDKGDFIGREALVQIKSNGPSRRLVPFKMSERGIPRHGYAILKNSTKVGEVTSGTHSPSLKVGIGLGFVDFPFHNIGSEITIEMRNKSIPAQIVKPPFWKNGTLMS
ncbi:MAG: glycine cleavage system protein T, partial [Candidatus Marinimicrobia bacterium]|nr:glycine cleavage system protein T [Candidatus Neomarinimicrobiota bacterium]